MSIRFPENRKENFVTFYSVTGLTFMINGAGDETKVADAQSACSCLQLCLQSDCVNKSGLTFSIESLESASPICVAVIS